MKKKLVSLFLCMGLAMSILAGCGNGNPEEEAKSKAAMEGNAGGTFNANDIFTYAIGGDTGNTLNPITADGRWGLMTCHLIYAKPYYIYADGTVDYILAESMEASEDGLVYTMKLKDGLKWSDGEALTADDIVFSYNAVNEVSQNMYVNGEPIKVEKVDDTTIMFTLPAVSAGAFELLSSEISIIPKHIFEGKSSFDINMLEEKIVGAGPYVLEEYKTGQYLKFKKNPNYVNGEADIDTIVYRIIEKDDTASLALQNGEVDAWIALPDTLDSFQNDDFHITNYSEGRVAYMTLNPNTENMKDKSYREGILRAVNREEIMLAAYTDEEFFKLGYSFLPENNSYYTDDVEKWEQDIEAARELTKDGAKSLTLCYVAEDTVQEKQALTIQAELKAIGIQVELVGLNQAGYMKAAFDSKAAEYDMFLGGYVMGADPEMHNRQFNTKKDNIFKYNHPEIDALFDEGNATLDQAERKEIYNKVQRLVSEEAIFYPFGSNLRTLVTSARVDGIEDAKLVPIYTFGDVSKLKLK